MAATTWTPPQARYMPETLEVVHTDHGTVRHYVLTRHGAVARTWLGSSLTEVVLRRPRHTRGTYQGAVEAVPGGWQARDHNNNPLGPVFNDYLEAEAMLLPRRTGVRARCSYDWPVWA